MLVAILAFVLGAAAGAIGAGGDSDDDDEGVTAAEVPTTATTVEEETTTTSAEEPTTTPEGDDDVRTHSDNEENPPQADVGPVECTRDQLGDLKATGTVTNHSSERSNYTVTVAFESPDGATQLDTSSGYIEDLEPGQAAPLEVVTFTDAPAEFTCRVTEVERYASF